VTRPGAPDAPLGLPLPEVRDGGIAVLRALVMCDLVDSTALLEELGDQAAAELMRRHDRLSRAILQRCGGQEIDKTDGFLILFERPVQAVAFALNYHRALSEFEAVENVRLRARVGVHVGEVLLWDNTREEIERGAKPVDVEGLAKPMAARLMALAGPGQTLMSGLAYALAERSQAELGARAGGVRWQLHGSYRFKGIVDPVEVWEVGEAGVAPFRAPPSGEKARRLLPWWRRGVGVAVAATLVVAAFAAPLYLSRRTDAALAFAPRDWVVIGDLRNLTSDPALQEPLETAFRVGLEQSRFVNVVPDLKVRQSLARMDRPRGTAIDREVGAEIALREGARALVMPTVAEVGGRVRVSAEVIDPNTQTTVYAESADGRGAESALASMDAVARELRGRLGEALGTIDGDSQPLERVTTGNLDALRAYSLGARAQTAGRFGEALGMYQQAIELDPEFALAHAGIARVQLSSDDPMAARPHLERALALKARLSAREALGIEALAAFYGPLDAMLERWRNLGTLYPDLYGAHANFALFAYLHANRYAEAAESARRALSNFNPRLGNTHYLLGTIALAQDDFEAAGRHLEAARELDGDALGLVHADLLAARRRFAEAEARLAAFQPSGVPSNDLAIETSRIALAIDQGRWDEALRASDAAAVRAGGVSVLQGYAFAVARLLLRTLEPGALDRAELARLGATLRGELDGEDVVLRRHAAFAILALAWAAAEDGDPALARRMLAGVAEVVQPLGQPLVSQMLVLAQARLAIAEDRAADAVALVSRLLDGSELYLARVTHAQALAAAGRATEAAAAWQWLRTHRGRAWAEFNLSGALRPLNVAWSQFAALALAEAAPADPEPLAGFVAAWPAESMPPSAAARLERLRARR
jgi:putative peptide modification system cyclase